MKTVKENKFCSFDSLNNESSVEQFFLIRLLADLGYTDSEIKTKQSIDELVVSVGRKKEYYKPDYVCYAQNKPKLVIDAKGIEENIDDFIYQCSGYSLALNRKYKGEKPVKYFLLSNGKTTKLFNWDEEEPILTLSFGDFETDNEKYKKLKSFISRDAILKSIIISSVEQDSFKFRKPDTKELNGIFTSCHNLIWKKENSNPTEAFYQFVKIMFIKLDQDKKLKNRLATGEAINKSEVTFSVHWIQDMEKIGEQNPFDTILFARLLERLETEVSEKTKKRIFEKTEHLDLRPSTVKEVVKILEHMNLFGIDEDLNGRLFEAFLNATIRGRDLGQYFTPRSVVKFMVKMADTTVNHSKIDYCLDACCGTGGFLIDAMADMSNKIDHLPLSDAQKTDLHKKLRTECLYGMEASKIIVRVSRINMYLHGDGGSRIYNLDSLDKKMSIEEGLDQELKKDLQELKDKIKTIKFDVILTNPPFARKYEKKKPDELEILKQYVLAYKDESSEKLYSSLKSSIMFLERNYDLLSNHGKLITIMDESVLNTSSNKPIRDFLKKHFIIKAVISLPQNTFVKAESGVKTSILYLVKKSNPTESQPPIFMAISENVGHTDAGKDALELSDLNIILEKFKQFEKGELVVTA